jgi:hypothetical protein
LVFQAEALDVHVVGDENPGSKGRTVPAESMALCKFIIEEYPRGQSM